MANFELRIDSQEFKRALDLLATVVNRKNALPILACAKFSYDPSRKIFTATAGNSEQWMQIECTRLQDGERRPWMFYDGKEKLDDFCLNIEDYREAFAVLPELPANCVLSVKDQALLLKVNYGKGEFTLPAEGAWEYPPVPETIEKGVSQREGTDPLAKFSIKTDVLMPMLQGARLCVANDPLRPVMNTICLDIHHDHFVIAASDGHTMYRNQKDTGMGWLDYGEFAADGSAKLLLPSGSIGAVIKAFSATEAISIVADTQRLRLQADGITLTTAQQEGKYPNYDSVIPKNQPHRVLLDRVEVLTTLRRLSIFSSESSNLGKLRQEEDQLQLQASDEEFSRQAGEHVAIVNAEQVDLGRDFCIGFKISHMQQMLSICQTEQVYLELRDASTALLLKEDDARSSLTLLVMPMLVNV